MPPLGSCDYLLFMEQHLYSSCFTNIKLISKCSESTLKMKSCVTAKYYYYNIIIKHIKVTGSCKLNRWRMTVQHNTRGEDGKGANSEEEAGMDPTEQVGLSGGRAGLQDGQPLLLRSTSWRDKINVALFVF